MRFVWLSATFYSYGSQTLTAWKDKWGLIPRSPRTNLRIHPSPDDRPTPPTQSLSTAFKCPSIQYLGRSPRIQKPIVLQNRKVVVAPNSFVTLGFLMPARVGPGANMEICGKFTSDREKLGARKDFCTFPEPLLSSSKFFFVILYVLHFRSIIWR